MDWYKDPFTKEHIADLRRKLGIARGKLEEIRQLMIDCPEARIGHLSIDVYALDDVLNETADP